MKLRILGTAQDGGIPHLGCKCDNCMSAIQEKQHRKISCIEIEGMTNTLIDATRDIATQLAGMAMKPRKSSIPVDRIFISHLHVGHYSGLLQFGKEVASTEYYPLYFSESVGNFLRENKPFSYLFERNQIMPMTFQTAEELDVDPNYTITPIEVNHRNEDGDTHGFKIRNTTSNKSCIYISDIDVLDNETVKLLDTADVVIFDGTFYSSNEIPRQDQVPHPPILETMDRMGTISDDRRFIFTHFNHTNPALHDKEKQDAISEMGYELAYDGMEIDL